MVQVHRARVDRLLRDPGGPTGTWLYELGRRVQQQAQLRSPGRSGRLRSSITTTRPVERAGRILLVRIGSAVSYAIYVHEGTRYVRARPFLREALQQVMR